MPAEIDAFSESVRRLLAGHDLVDGWLPGRAVDDHRPDLSAALAGVGWSELPAAGEDALPFIGAAAVEMGRAVAPFIHVVSVLGGSPSVQGLAMYGGSLGAIAVPGPDGYSVCAAVESRPVNFADSLGVHLVSLTGTSAAVAAPAQRMAAWETATVGYLAGLADSSVSRAIDHARQRQVFGRTLAQIETVQQRLADAATVSDSLVLAAHEGASGLAALAHATGAVGGVMTHCHQVFGAIGFTIEFPMQRYSRRAKAIASFANAWIDQRLDAAA